MFAVERRRYLPVLFRDITVRGRHAVRVAHDTNTQYYSTHIHRAVRTQNATQRPENRGECGTYREKFGGKEKKNYLQKKEIPLNQRGTCHPDMLAGPIPTHHFRHVTNFVN